MTLNTESGPSRSLGKEEVSLILGTPLKQKLYKKILSFLTLFKKILPQEPDLIDYKKVIQNQAEFFKKNKRLSDVLDLEDANSLQKKIDDAFKNRNSLEVILKILNEKDFDLVKEFLLLNPANKIYSFRYLQTAEVKKTKLIVSKNN